MRMRKTMAFGGSVALLAAGVLSGQAVAAAKADAGIGFRDVQNWTVRPGGSPANLVPRILTSSGPNDPEGTFVYALSAKPLTGGAWSGKLPAGMTAEPGRGCTPKAGVPGVFLCDYRDWNARAPRVRTAVGAADGATVHFGVVLVPKGASVDRGVRQAQTAAARPEDRRHAARTVTVKTAEHAARNIVDLHAPGLKAGGGWVRQSVKMNVVDATKLEISFAPAKGQRPWDGIEPGVEIGSLSVTGPAKCFPNPMVTSFAPSIVCDVRRPDKVTVSYRLKARADTEAWKIRSAAVLRVWNEDPRNPQSVARFAVDSPRPVRDRHDLMARGKDGRLWSHSGTGDAALALDPQVMDPVGKGFGQYDRLLKLSPITGQNAGAGVLGRDRSGVLWFHPMGRYEGLAPRTRVSAGWNEYDELIGASDVTGDRTPDLLARDPEGNLYVYAGRPGPTWRIGNRTTLDGGWERYDRIVGASDVTGDGNPDLVARDRAGVLWLRAGTGDLTDPFRARTRVGAGWGVYRSLSGPGDLTDDGRADLVAQDAAGDVWLYRGTGKASAPFAPPVKALLGSDNGGEVKGYDALL